MKIEQRERGVTQALPEDPVRSACLAAREPGVFRARWERVLREAGIDRRVHAVRALQTHYFPERSGCVLFAAAVAREDPDRRARRCYLALELSPRESSAARRAAAAEEPGRQNRALGPSVFEIPEWNATCRVLPGARRLREIRSFLDESMFRDFVARTGLGGEIGSPPRLMRYVPSARAILRWRSRRGLRYINTYAPGGDPPAVENLAWIERGTRAADAGFRSPEILAYEPFLRTIVTKGMRGTALTQRLAKEDPDELRRVGRALAGLHGMSGTPPCRPTDDDQASVLRAAAEGIRCAMPDLSLRLGALCSSLEVWQPEPRDQRPIHGNLSGDQVLIHGKRIAIVDWDDLTLGDPAHDLGRLAAHIHYEGIGRKRRLEDVAPLLSALLAEYRNGGGGDVCAHALHWHLVAALVVRAEISGLRTLGKEWSRRVEDSVTEAARIWRLGAQNFRRLLLPASSGSKLHSGSRHD